MSSTPVFSAIRQLFPLYSQPPKQPLRCSHHTSRLSTQYCFQKPNDTRALNLMNAAAVQVMTMLADLVIAYGVSDEFSFVFHKSTEMFERRASKLISTIVSTFTSVYVHLWSQYFPGTSLSLSLLPTFDGRAVCYPSMSNLRDYMSWRQVDCRPYAAPGENLTR
jgi:tRNA(His) guanylyltransferase